uniref:Uncharacterized protein n=1 Tax=viral metagenome TaxID=1070528 RepID=A0A6M3IMC3_9ZZZZ
MAKVYKLSPETRKKAEEIERTRGQQKRQFAADLVLELATMGAGAATAPMRALGGNEVSRYLLKGLKEASGHPQDILSSRILRGTGETVAEMARWPQGLYRKMGGVEYKPAYSYNSLAGYNQSTKSILLEPARVSIYSKGPRFVARHELTHAVNHLNLYAPELSDAVWSNGMNVHGLYQPRLKNSILSNNELYRASPVELLADKMASLKHLRPGSEAYKAAFKNELQSAVRKSASFLTRMREKMHNRLNLAAVESGDSPLSREVTDVHISIDKTIQDMNLLVEQIAGGVK